MTTHELAEKLLSFENIPVYHQDENGEHSDVKLEYGNTDDTEGLWVAVVAE